MKRHTLALLLCATNAALAAVPSPKEVLGFTPGDDYKLADYSQLTSYFQKAAQSSDRIRFIEFGKTSLGKPMYIAFISAPENLKKLDRYREINRRLALGQASAADARVLSEEGKVFVWIDSGLHASEVAPSQHAPELLYKMLTDESDELQSIRRNVILMQIPCINPDGLDMAAHWYRENVGTEFETAPLPWLYQKYAGHDNNRDWFMLNLEETRHVTRLLFREWFPEIVYNQHQAPPFPARIFVPPYADPLNPNIPAPIMEGINLIGMAMKERFARENKPGILSYFGFDAWWNGGLRSVPAFHNMHGILTETAQNSFATPRVYKQADFAPSFANGIPTAEPSVFYERPWMGGKWGVRDAIDYMLTADLAILAHASQRRADYLHKSWEMARASKETTAAPYAYVIPPQQWDGPTALDMLERLSLAGIDIERASREFKAAGATYPEGSYVTRSAQPFRPYLVDLLEPRKYPDLKTSAAKRPYDIAGWTLPLQMGVTVARIDGRFEAALTPATQFRSEGSVTGAGTALLLDHRENASFLATAFFLDRSEKVSWSAAGDIIVDSAYSDGPARPENLAHQFGIRVVLAHPASAKPAFELKRPRVAVYQPWLANADQGWTEWVFDQYRVPYSLIHNDDFQKDDLRTRFDTIVLAQQTAQSILHGTRTGEKLTPADGDDHLAITAIQRPEYSGGIGIAGAARLQKFVRDGGTLIALDTATELPIQFFPLPMKNVVPGSGFYCPGSLLRISVDAHNPIGFGMPAEAIAFSSGAEAFETTLASEVDNRAIRSVAQFAKANLLASGWVSGDKAVLGKHAVVEALYGRGRIVLFAMRPQFRGQSFGTFKFLLNAVYLGSARAL